MSEQDQGYALDWDTLEVVDDGGDFVLLEAGTYPFMVSEFERKRFEGSAKITTCPKAEIKLIVDAGAQGIVTIVDSLLLHSKTAWRVARFFESLGAPKNPETNAVTMDWNNIIGKNGWAEFGPRTYKNDKGEDRQTNDVKKYLKPSEWPEQGTATTATPQAAPAPSMQQPAQQQIPTGQPQQQSWQNAQWSN